MGLGLGRRAKTNPSALTAYQLALSALGDADAWWKQQGSAPPPLQLTVGPSVDGEHNGYGYYNSGRVVITPEYLRNVQNTMQHSATRQGRVQLLAGVWRLMAHERGHNIGYQHAPGGLMDEAWASPPGEAYAWASRMLPPVHPRLIGPAHVGRFRRGSTP